MFPPPQKPCFKPSKPKRHHHASKVACNNGNPNPNNSPRNNRRDILIGLGGLYGATTLSSNNTGSAFDYVLPNTPLRIRKPAHLLTGDYIAKYKEAVKRMQALPPDDPRNFRQQANVQLSTVPIAMVAAIDKRVSLTSSSMFTDLGYSCLGTAGISISMRESWGA
ncbi:hypothetical protein JHK87_036578 [Glycine soja]|nr:hypothetical protein JHK87_036578 [Glycine soja]